MVSQEKLKHVCIIGNVFQCIFVKIQSILTILALKRNVLMININIEQTLLQILSYGGCHQNVSHILNYIYEEKKQVTTFVL